jgi:outer membrane protein assembly factor BamB
VIAGIAGDRIVALSATGALRWSFIPDGGFSGAITIVGELVYAGSLSGSLHQIALDTGAELRRIATGASGPVRSGPVAEADGIIYFAAADRFYALLPDGAVAPRCDITEVAEAAPVPLGYGGVLLAGLDGTIVSIRSDGSYRWAARLEAPVRATPAADSDSAYFGDDSGRIYAIR